MNALSRLRAGGTALLLLSFLGAPADAGSVSANYSLTANVNGNCVINTVAGLSFPNFTGVQDTVSGVMASITCSATASWTVGINNGLNWTTTRRMKSGANFISYQIYKNVGMTTVWDTTNQYSGTSGTTSMTGWGKIPAATLPPNGTYTDTVGVVISF